MTQSKDYLKIKTAKPIQVRNLILVCFILSISANQIYDNVMR